MGICNGWIVEKGTGDRCFSRLRGWVWDERLHMHNFRVSCVENAIRCQNLVRLYGRAEARRRMALQASWNTSIAANTWLWICKYFRNFLEYSEKEYSNISITCSMMAKFPGWFLWYLIPWLASGSVRQEPIQTRPIESQWNAESSNYTVILHAFETSFQIERSAPRLPQTTHAGDSAVDDLKGLCGPCNFGTGSGAHPFYFSLENFISERGKSGSSILLFLGMFPSIATMR